MPWIQLGTPIAITTDWQYSSATTAEYFRLKHSNQPIGTLYQICSAQLNNDGTVDLFDTDAQTLAVDIENDVVHLPAPGCLTSRSLAVRRLPTAPSFEQQSRQLFVPTMFQYQVANSSFYPSDPSQWAVNIQASDYVSPVISASDSNNMYKLVKTVKLNTSADYTFTNLAGDTDLKYKISVSGALSGDSNILHVVSIRPNNDTNTANYRNIYSSSGSPNYGLSTLNDQGNSWMVPGLLLAPTFYNQPTVFNAECTLSAASGIFRVLLGTASVIQSGNSAQNGNLLLSGFWLDTATQINSLTINFGGAPAFNGVASLGVLNQ